MRRLVAAHANLRTEAERIAQTVLDEISFESVADEVEEAARALDLDDLEGRSGGHSWGYVEPSEAAQELLEEALDRILEDMKRHLSRPGSRGVGDM